VGRGGDLDLTARMGLRQSRALSEQLFAQGAAAVRGLIADAARHYFAPAVGDCRASW